jgi:hypothetical protein
MHLVIITSMAAFWRNGGTKEGSHFVILIRFDVVGPDDRAKSAAPLAAIRKQHSQSTQQVSRRNAIKSQRKAR